MEISKKNQKPKFIGYCKSLEFCKICDIKRGTLRCWLKNDLVYNQKVPDSNYYIYDAEISFYNVCNIKLLQNIGLSLKQIANIEEMESANLIELYKQKASDITTQIEALNNSLNTINERISVAQKTQNFETNTKTTLQDFPYQYVYPQNLNNIPLLKERMTNKAAIMTVLPIHGHDYKEGDDMSVIGYATNNVYNDVLVWQKKPNSKFFNTILCQKNLNGVSGPRIIDILPIDFVNDVVLNLAPDKQAATNFNSTKQPKNIKQIRSTLEELGFKIKNILCIWLMNTTIKGEWRTCHDIYIEF